jgi:preprotein translocase subunit SecE
MGGKGGMDAAGRLKGRPGVRQQDVAERRAKPTAYNEESMKKIVQFVKESYAELRKVIWPSREDVVSSVKVVIISTIIIAAILGLVDVLLLFGIRAIF